MGIRAVSRTLFRGVWICLKWPLLLTLPITILPTITGLLYGFYFSFWRDGLVETHTNAFLHEMRDMANDWGVPEMTFRDFQDRHNDFHVLRLNFNDWASKLGYINPIEYSYDNSQTPINKYADLTTLMVDSSCRTSPPQDQWVYISRWAWPTIDDWDSAFSDAVQAAYVPSILNSSRLFFVKCDSTSGFLCGIWGVRAPTLLHFHNEDAAPDLEDMEPGLTYSVPLEALRPVTVRVIELPLQDAYTGLPLSVFPGPKEQMLAMMRGDGLWEQFDPWDEFSQTWNRFDEYINENYYERKGTMLYYLGKVDEWMADHLLKPLGLDDISTTIFSVCMLMSIGQINIFLLPPWHFIEALFKGFIGYPLPGDQILGDGFEKEWNPWDEIMGMPQAFMNDVIAKIKTQSGDAYPDGKITTGSEGLPLSSIKSPLTTAPS